MEPSRGKDLSPDYEDDPERGIYWGPKQPNGMMTRWSRLGSIGAASKALRA
jgi:hypothetical protein